MPKNPKQSKSSNTEINDKPGSLMSEILFRQALDRTDMPATPQKIGGFIVRMFNASRGCAWPTVSRIAFECSCSEAAVYAAIGKKGVLADWFKVRKVWIDGKLRNTYVPNWEKAAAVNREFEIRLKKWKEENHDFELSESDSEDDHRKQTPERPESGSDDTSKNWRSAAPEFGGHDLQNLEPIEVRAQNLGDRSDINPVPSSGPGMRARSNENCAYGAGWLNEKLYQQTPEQAEQAFQQLTVMQWLTDADDPEYQPTGRSKHGARVQFYKLLKKGISASQLLRAAELYLRKCPSNQIASLGGWLARYADEQCTETDHSWYVPQVDPRDQPLF